MKKIIIIIFSVLSIILALPTFAFDVDVTNVCFI